MKNITLLPDGSINVSLENIQSVGIENIFDVVSHRILRDGDTTTHQIELVDGGKVNLSYHKNKLIKFENHLIGLTITKKNEIIIRKYSEPVD
ncbi:MAG: hypothetical protein SFX19_02240 [Alphaproteobacteria bacterium]|nr:hypothetical protein [Alphaproteobacteria bacterium]